MSKWIELDVGARVAGIIPAGEKLLGQNNTAYERMCAEARELSDNGLTTAFFVPATRFMIDATLGILQQPEVTWQLPAEVTSRAKIANDIVRDVAQVGVDKGFFLEAYTNRENLRTAEVAPAELVALDEADYLGSIGGAPFFDVSVVAGGGLNFLQENRVEKDLSAILQRSVGMLTVAHLRKDETEGAFTFLGTPYVDSRFLCLSDSRDSEEFRVNFSDDAHSFLKQLYGHQGCPTGRMGSENGWANLLEDYWRKIVAYLIPDDATTNAYQPQPADLALPVSRPN